MACNGVAYLYMRNYQNLVKLALVYKSIAYGLKKY